MVHYGHMLRLLYCSTSQSVTQALGEMDLTSAQGHIIGYLAHCQVPPCPHDVEESFGLSHPTVSGLLARLEKKGFVELRADETDRRCKRIHMLPKGWELNDRIRGIIQVNEERIVQGFSETEKSQFADFLARAARNMGSELNSYYIQEEEKA